jgi:uncharacterized phage protein (TIGR02220 family)
MRQHWESVQNFLIKSISHSQRFIQEGEKKLSNYTAIRELVKRISGQDNTFTIPRIYVQFTGDLTSAVLLNQIVFYSDKSKRTDGYFYKTYKEWEEEVCLTERQVRLAVGKLKDKGIIETKLMKANGSPTVHYKLHFDKLAESILTLCQIPMQQNVSIQPNNMSESLTENTTEKTTENYMPFQEIISYLNDTANTKYKDTSRKTKDLIRARWNEGFVLDDFKTVIDIKTKEWLKDEAMNKYLRPETLFGTKFESYLNQRPTIKKVEKPKETVTAGALDEFFGGDDW